jgi:hypothetical protein
LSPKHLFRFRFRFFIQAVSPGRRFQPALKYYQENLILWLISRAGGYEIHDKIRLPDLPGLFYRDEKPEDIPVTATSPPRE